MNEETTISRLVDAITQKSFRGWLPPDADAIVDAVEQCFPDLRTVHDQLLLEVQCRLAVQESLVIFNQVTFLN
jgi:hypothetical protein